MARLTKKQTTNLLVLGTHLDRAMSYLDRDTTYVCVERRHPTCATDYVPMIGKPYGELPLGLSPVNKWVGSDLCGLQDVRAMLRDFLQNHGFMSKA